jgi:ferredoxin
MANRNEKTVGNAPGKFYVDQTCVDCDMCRGIAPEVFRRDDDLGQTVAHRQPSTNDEIALATEAMLGCPSDSIGNDG